MDVINKDKEQAPFGREKNSGVPNLFSPHQQSVMQQWRSREAPLVLPKIY